MNFLIPFFASIFIWFLFFGLIILWFIDGKIKKEQVVHAIFSVFLSLILANIFKLIFPTFRPFMVNGDPTFVLIPPTGGAFPSEHTTTAFALAVTIFLHDRKIGWVYLTSALIIGVARVIANVHYPIDILGGALLGTLVAVIVDKVHFFKILNK